MIWEFAHTLIVLLALAFGALFTMSGAVLAVVDRQATTHGAATRWGAPLAIIGLALFFLGSNAVAGLAL
ncbi:hypothetical protein BH11PSE6_BH11PSE6_01770 [soil metagenome]